MFFFEFGNLFCEFPLSQFALLSAVCGPGTLTGKDLFYRYVNVIFTRKFWTLVTWTGLIRGKVKKQSFSTLLRIIKFVLMLLRRCDPNISDVQMDGFFKKAIYNSKSATRLFWGRESRSRSYRRASRQSKRHRSIAPRQQRNKQMTSAYRMRTPVLKIVKVNRLMVAFFKYCAVNSVCSQSRHTNRNCDWKIEMQDASKCDVTHHCFQLSYCLFAVYVAKRQFRYFNKVKSIFISGMHFKNAMRSFPTWQINQWKQ